MKKNALIISPGPTMQLSANPGKKAVNEKFNVITVTTSEIKEIRQTKKVGDTRVVCFKYKYKLRHYYNLMFLFKSIFLAIRMKFTGENIDLIITYDPIRSGFLGVIVKKILGAKLITEVNGVYSSDAVWMDEPNTIFTRLKRKATFNTIKFVFKHADAIKMLFDKQIEAFNSVIKNQIVRVYPAPTRIEMFQDLKYEEKKEVLFVGFPFKLKGIDILIDAFKKIADKHPDWKLKILGWFPDPRELYAKIDNHPQIYHHKPVFHNEMPEHIGSCSILVLPSRSEAMGRVLVEAMAAGKARIGSNIDGIPTVINDNVDGLLFECENVDDLSEKLNLLITDNALRKKLGEKGRERAGEEFNNEKFLAHELKFYDDVISI